MLLISAIVTDSKLDKDELADKLTRIWTESVLDYCSTLVSYY